MSGQGVLKKPGLFSLRERRLNEEFEFFKSHHVEGEIDLVCVFPEWRKSRRGDVRGRGRAVLYEGDISNSQQSLKNLWVGHIMGDRKSVLVPYLSHLNFCRIASHFLLVITAYTESCT